MNHKELPAELRRHLPTHGTIPDNVRTLMRRPQPASGLDLDAQNWGAVSRRTSDDYAGQPGNRTFQSVDDHGLHPFMKRLQHEQRRAARTKTPLSIVLFRIEGAGKSDFGKIRRFYEAMYRISRETDIPARFGVSLIAILLLDTNLDGATAFTRKILGHAKELVVSTIAQTYPNFLFDNFVSGPRDELDPDPFVLDDPATHGHPGPISAALAVARKKWSDILGVVNRPGFG